MKKGMAVSVAVVLLVGASAFAQVDNIVNQQQLLFTPPHTLSSSLSVTGPAGVGTTGLDPVTIALDQTATANSGQTAANQHITGSLSLDGNVNTQGSATMTLTQSLDVQTVGITGFINPGQLQTMEGDGDATQSQGFQLAGGQVLTKYVGGYAIGAGTNDVVDMSLIQNVAGTGTTGTESVLINGLATTDLSGNANASGTATTNLSIITAQYQKISQ
jgi:hypothetical protein